MMEHTLKPCPFCGHDDINVSEREHPYQEGKGYFLWCDKCGAKTDVYDTEKKAIKKWNRRAYVSDKTDQEASECR